MKKIIWIVTLFLFLIAVHSNHNGMWSLQDAGASIQPAASEKVDSNLEAIRSASRKYKIPENLLIAMMEKESNGKVDAMRFEEHVAKKLPFTPDRDALASSHGLLQVMGYHKEFCKLESWRDLYDAEVNVDCAAKLLRDNLKRGTPKEAITAYNGTNDRAREYAEDIINKWLSMELR